MNKDHLHTVVVIIVFTGKAALNGSLPTCMCYYGYLKTKNLCSRPYKLLRIVYPFKFKVDVSLSYTNKKYVRSRPEALSVESKYDRQAIKRLR